MYTVEHVTQYRCPICKTIHDYEGGAEVCLHNCKIRKSLQEKCEVSLNNDAILRIVPFLNIDELLKDTESPADNVSKSFPMDKMYIFEPKVGAPAYLHCTFNNRTRYLATKQIEHANSQSFVILHVIADSGDDLGEYVIGLKEFQENFARCDRM